MYSKMQSEESKNQNIGGLPKQSCFKTHKEWILIITLVCLVSIALIVTLCILLIESEENRLRRNRASIGLNSKTFSKNEIQDVEIATVDTGKKDDAVLATPSAEAIQYIIEHCNFYTYPVKFYFGETLPAGIFSCDSSFSKEEFSSKISTDDRENFFKGFENTKILSGNFVFYSDDGRIAIVFYSSMNSLALNLVYENENYFFYVFRYEHWSTDSRQQAPKKLWMVYQNNKNVLSENVKSDPNSWYKSVWFHSLRDGPPDQNNLTSTTDIEIGMFMKDVIPL